MFKRFFGKKEENKTQECVQTTDYRLEVLRKDNTVLMGKLATAQVEQKELSDANDALRAQVKKLETALKEAEGKATTTPVKYVQARKTLTKARLRDLRTRLESVPSNANGFGGSVSIYDKKTKRVSVVEFKSKADALAVLERAEKGNVDIIM